eukprot:jgi/Hompol1/2685/HPOL_006140-RA
MTIIGIIVGSIAALFIALLVAIIAIRRYNGPRFHPDVSLLFPSLGPSPSVSRPTASKAAPTLTSDSPGMSENGYGGMQMTQTRTAETPSQLESGTAAMVSSGATNGNYLHSNSAAPTATALACVRPTKIQTAVQHLDNNRTSYMIMSAVPDRNEGIHRGNADDRKGVPIADPSVYTFIRPSNHTSLANVPVTPPTSWLQASPIPFVEDSAMMQGTLDRGDGRTSPTGHRNPFEDYTHLSLRSSGLAGSGAAGWRMSRISKQDYSDVPDDTDDLIFKPVAVVPPRGPLKNLARIAHGYFTGFKSGPIMTSSASSLVMPTSQQTMTRATATPTPTPMSVPVGPATEAVTKRSDDWNRVPMIRTNILDVDESMISGSAWYEDTMAHEFAEGAHAGDRSMTSYVGGGGAVGGTSLRAMRETHSNQQHL